MKNKKFFYFSVLVSLFLFLIGYKYGVAATAVNYSYSPDSSQIQPSITSPTPKQLVPTIDAPDKLQNQVYPSACPQNIYWCPGPNCTRTFHVIGCPKPGDATTDPATCPHNCSVTQYPLNPTSTDKINNPVCPDGYVQISSYNSQPEYAYSPTPIVRLPKTLVEMNQYISNGFSCNATGNSYEQCSVCATTSPKQYSQGSRYDTYKANMVVEVYYEYEHCYPKGSSCGGNKLSNGSVCPPKNSVVCTDVSDSIHDYKATQVICTKPAGNYQTGRYIQASIVCARANSTWQ